MTSTDYAEQLRMADLRVTRPRIAVLEAVQANPHADTEAIFGAVRVRLPEVSRQAVYDVLSALTTAGLVRRIQPSGSVARYESRVGDNHHHVVCRVCGVIADVDCAVGEAPCLTPSDDNGFAFSMRPRSSTGVCARTARHHKVLGHIRDHCPIHQPPEGMLCLTKCLPPRNTRRAAAKAKTRLSPRLPLRRIGP